MIEAPSILCDETFPLSLDTLFEAYGNEAYHGAEVAIWVFDGHKRRLEFEAKFQAAGIKARIRSAYKPLVHAFLEEIDLGGIDDIEIRYPVVEGNEAERFRLEAYPATALVGNRAVHLTPADVAGPDDLPTYELTLRGNTGDARRIDVAAPNVSTTDPMGHKVMASTGWIQITGAADPIGNIDQAFQTDQELAFARAIEILRAYPTDGGEPYFDRLQLRIEAPFYDQPLPVGMECLSTAEAMHEDIYFAGLETFKARAGAGETDRKIAPGQIVPEIITTDKRVRVCVYAEPDPLLVRDVQPSPGPMVRLATVERWLEPETMKSHLDALGGAAYEARSWRGRPIWGRYFEGDGAGFVISSGQHANETSGPVGALRAGEQLLAEGIGNFALAPLNNPDGFALFREQVDANPHHMHHAARYTAAGCDLERYERQYENEIRHLGRELTGANLHLNLHGYPSHEWTRPFSGYVPREFARWTLPKGFFLILNYHPGYKEQGEAVIQSMVEALGAYEPIVRLNREQLARRRAYVDDSSFELMNEIPVFTEERDKSIFPIEIITEAPDETIYGEDFIHAHTAQMIVTLAAARGYREHTD
ncbi:MAG: M14 family zinc carboxypeptidase [Pseudomonadota bacterium]